MPITQTIKNAAIKAKNFVTEHKQTIFNSVMLVGISGVAAAVVYATRENNLQNKNVSQLNNNQIYFRIRTYEIEREIGMPVHRDDKRYMEIIESGDLTIPTR